MKLDHYKDSRHVRPIADSQTVKAQIFTDTMGQESNSKICLRRGTLHC